jgi:hypothetical protein
MNGARVSSKGMYFEPADTGSKQFAEISGNQINCGVQQNL